jgi:hypothetical protein
MKTLLTMIAVLVVLSPAYAQKTKTPDVGDYPFWSTTKQPHARPFIPGLNAVLQLTAEQTEQINKAKEEILGADDVKAAIKAGKVADANARSVVETANKRLHEKVESILTPKQKDLIEKVNATFTDVRKSVTEAKQADFAAAKGNKEEMAKLQAEVQEKTASEFNSKLTSLLSAEQKTALDKAAEEEKKRAANSSKTKKPGK